MKDKKLIQLYNQKKKAGLTPEQERKLLVEISGDQVHRFPQPGPQTQSKNQKTITNIYNIHDFAVLQQVDQAMGGYFNCLRSMDELLERDKQREQDGFPRKIQVGKLIRPGKGGKDKIVVVPATVEEKFIHDNSLTSSNEEKPSGGSGEGEEGEVIGEQPVRTEQEGQGQAGQGEGGPHETESSAYDLGKILTEKFELPNLKNKGKKRSFTRYTYDLTDKNRGFGQVLDKKATLRQILETNLHLGNIPDFNDIDPTRFLISPSDKVFRVLSKEKDYESQAMVFFLRDYSGSMAGKTTELIVGQHILIYSWLLYQYSMQVESRFILHDTQAKEVPDFFTYYNSSVAGGTQIAAAFRLVNEIVKKENLERDYNIYVFHGTDGDDWDTDGRDTIPEINQMIKYSSRLGITVARHSYGSRIETELEKYLYKSKLLEQKPALIRMDIIDEDATESRLIQGIKKLISE